MVVILMVPILILQVIPNFLLIIKALIDKSAIIMVIRPLQCECLPYAQFLLAGAFLANTHTFILKTLTQLGIPIQEQLIILHMTLRIFPFGTHILVLIVCKLVMVQAYQSPILVHLMFLHHTPLSILIIFTRSFNFQKSFIRSSVFH